MWLAASCRPEAHRPATLHQVHKEEGSPGFWDHSRPPNPAPHPRALLPSPASPWPPLSAPLPSSTPPLSHPPHPFLCFLCSHSRAVVLEAQEAPKHCVSSGDFPTLSPSELGKAPLLGTALRALSPCGLCHSMGVPFRCKECSRESPQFQRGTQKPSKQRAF